MAARRKLSLGAFVVAALTVALVVAFFVSPWASGEPDGLNRVAIDHGFADQHTEHALEAAPTAGYAIEGVDDGRFGTGMAGVIGVAVTFTLAVGLAYGLRRRSRASTA